MEHQVRSVPEVDARIGGPPSPTQQEGAQDHSHALFRHFSSPSSPGHSNKQQHDCLTPAPVHAHTTPASAQQRALVLTPAEIYAQVVHHGQVAAEYPSYKLALLAVAAGCYCGFGFTVCCIVGGNAPKQWLEDSPGLFSLLFGAVGFPFSFTLIMVCGAELYTSMCAYMTAAWWERKVCIWTCLRMWVLSWFWNFVGCAIFVGFMYASGTYHHKDWYIKLLVVKKVSKGWGEVVVQGMFANWLVCIAAWQAKAAQDLTGKAVAIWLPISAFAMLGFEHCIANQFLIPMGIALGAPVSAKQFVWHNLIPATLGNWIGGAINMATVYAFVYGTPPKQIEAWYRARGQANAASGPQSDVVAVISSGGVREAKHCKQ